MPEEESIKLTDQLPECQKNVAFNTEWTYSYMSNAAFYTMISPAYYDFMNRWVRHWLYWYDGYVPYFHNPDNGIISTRIASSLCDRVAKKVVGGRIMFKNSGKEASGVNALNPSLKFISGEWSPRVDFSKTVKQAVQFAAASGTALLKLNMDKRGLWSEALRFDSFIPATDYRGEVAEVKCFLKRYTDLGAARDKAGKNAYVYYIVEHRYYGDYALPSGKILKNRPLSKIVIKRNTGNITNGQYISDNTDETIELRSLPDNIRKSVINDFSVVRFNAPALMPFIDSLGVELLTWTDGVGNIPQLPFGESFLSPIIAELMSYDYYHSASNTDMYLGRGRVLTPRGITGAKGNSNYNSGLDSFMFTKLDYVDPENQKPIPLQFDLRSASWREIRNTLIENVSIKTGLNISTIASFLNDSNARTAREISTEENETAGFVDDKRETVERPINKLLKTVLRFYGYKDDVVIRWSAAGLTNKHSLTEIIALAKQGGFLSQRKAVEMFNYDDDDEQVQEEYLRVTDDVKAQQAQPAFGAEAFNEKDYFGAGEGGEEDKPDTA
jgi:hypothetical protein